MKRPFLFFLLVLFSTTVSAQSTNKMSSISDVKIVLAQCSGRYVFTIGLINAGVITYPAGLSKRVMANYSETSQNLLAIADRLPGADARTNAEKFFNLLKSRYNDARKNSTNDTAAAKNAMEEAFQGIDKCLSYMSNPTVRELLEGY